MLSRVFNLPGSSVHEILQARILKWVAIPFSRRSSLPRDRTSVSCIGRGILYHWTTRESFINTFFPLCFHLSFLLQFNFFFLVTEWTNVCCKKFRGHKKFKWKKSLRHSQPWQNHHWYILVVTFKDCRLFHHVKTVMSSAPQKNKSYFWLLIYNKPTANSFIHVTFFILIVKKDSFRV